MSTIGYPTPELPRLRLTTRGRAVLGVIAAVPVLTVAVLLGIQSGGAVATGERSGTDFTFVTVGGGESLWDLATDVAPAADPREFIADVIALNRLASADVEAGQRLAIPAEYAD